MSSCVDERISNGRSYTLNSGLCSIVACYFARFSQFSGNGGIVCLTGSSSLSISDSAFSNSTVFNAHGGAIYVSTSGSSNIVRTCGSMGSINTMAESTYMGHIIYAQTPNSQINLIKESSFSHCGLIQNTAYGTVYMYYGSQTFSINNASKNRAYLGSGVHIWYPGSLSSSYCQINDNLDRNHIVFHYYGGTLSYFNVINNSVDYSNGHVIRFVQGSDTITRFVMINNKYVLLDAHYGNYARLTATYCIIVHQYELTKGWVGISDSISGSTATHRITHYSNDLCFNFETPEASLIPSMKNTYEPTPYDTPASTLNPSEIQTFEATLIDTFIPSEIRTFPPEPTPARTYPPDLTPKETGCEYQTPYRSYDSIHYQTNNQFESLHETTNDTKMAHNSIMLSSIVFLLIIILIFNVIMCMKHNKYERSSSTISEVPPIQEKQEMGYPSLVVYQNDPYSPNVMAW